MALDTVSSRVFREAAIPGVSDVGTSSAPIDSSGTKQFPKLTAAQSSANVKAAGGTTSTGSNNPLTGAAGGALDKNAFLKLLVQEMTNQDPLKPADNTQFVAQLAQFSTLEQMQNMNDGFKTLQSSFSTAEARGLLGVPVKAVDGSTGAQIDGVVDQIILSSDGKVRVDVNGTAVDLGDIISVGPGAAASSSTSGTSGASLPGTLVPPTKSGTGQ